MDTNHERRSIFYRRVSRTGGHQEDPIASGYVATSRSKIRAISKSWATHHVGGYLEDRPEHTEEGPLLKMMEANGQQLRPL
ncbi:hypothetical protein MJ561_25170 [Klebsiella pneumoniae]|nr:hypothetical protein MJ561_25170 [Klebsiella pneumoniae]